MSKYKSRIFTALGVICCLTGLVAGEKITLGRVEGLTAAFGDFNWDRFTDIFTIAPDYKSFRIYFQQEKNDLFDAAFGVKCDIDKLPSETVLELVPGDFTGDGQLDVLLVTSSSSATDSLTHIRVLRGDTKDLNCPTDEKGWSKIPVLTAKGRPFVLDYNGDMIADLLGVDESGSRCVWFGRRGGEFESCRNDTFYTFADQPISNPHSNAFAALNNDKAPDIFIDTPDQFEYWHAKESGFGAPILARKTPDIRQSIFVDINGDGTIEQVYPTCSNANCDDSKIKVRQHESWSEELELFTFPKENNYTIKLTHEKPYPLGLISGDVDADGFPDFITLVKDQTGANRVALLMNVASNTKIGNISRTFRLQLLDVKLPEEHKVIGASFFDLKEDGKLDILVTSQHKTNTSDIRLSSVLNVWMVDSYFMKVIVASGICYNNCPAINMSYGTTQQYGPHLCFKLAGNTGEFRQSCAAQLSQSAHFSLQLPYIIFGLGETPHFVEYLDATIPSGGTKDTRTRTWEQIVPDAQVVLIPYPSKEPSRWVNKLFLRPGEIIFQTLITLASICCVLVVIIAFLHRKEILEDLAEHEEYKRHWPESR